MAQGLDEHQQLAPDSIKRGLAALERFQAHLQDLPSGQVKIVGTHTLRQAKNAKAFLKPAETILGAPIQVISGAEEGRLTFQGVALTRQIDVPTLLVDIGGGSTELVLGDAQGIQHVSSRAMGCVVYRERFFNSGQTPIPFQFRQARNEARVQIDAVERRFNGFEAVVGSSGTIKAIAQVGEAFGLGADITPHSIEIIEDQLCALNGPDFIEHTGISAERYSVLPAGVAVLQGVFQQLKLERMEATDGALREGLLAQFLPESAIDKVREKTIRSLQTRFSVDAKQAKRVRRSALEFADALGLVDEGLRALLADAASVHELGQSISYSDHHEHGAYLLTHSDLPGFNRQDQSFLADLVGFQRKRIPTLDEWSSKQRWALACLRLAILCHVSRQDDQNAELVKDGAQWGLSGMDPWRVGDFSKEAKRLSALGLCVRPSQAD